MSTRADGYDPLMGLWSIQESLLQTYRSLFLTAESVIFAVAAATMTTSFWSTSLLWVIGWFILVMWREVCSNRAKDVSLVQWLLLQAEEGKAVDRPFRLLKDFQDGYAVTIGDRHVWRGHRAKPRHKADDTSALKLEENFPKMLRSMTRVKMDRNLPNLFSILWCFAVLMSAYSKLRESQALWETSCVFAAVTVIFIIMWLPPFHKFIRVQTIK